jgi:murein DD-endopeptidase MepM/ murein hydrolase activator NlpD
MKKRKHPAVQNDYSHHMNFYHPPLLPMPDIPVCLHYGSYLIKRRFDVHTGIDLYAPIDAPVYAIEYGEVIAIRPFTGKHAGCEHWNETWDVCIEGYSGIFSYGEIKPIKELKVGDVVESGDIIGNVLRVLKSDKGKAMSMLHFSIHTHGWKGLLKDQDDPEKEHFFDLQQDPTLLLLQLKNKADIMDINAKIDYIDANEKIDRIHDRLYRLEPDSNWRT